MKDIDFLPEWYKSGIRREVSYRTQYIALGGIFLVMAVWSLTTSRSISKARAEFADMAAIQTRAQSVSKDLTGLENQLSSLRKKLGSIEEIDSRIDVAAVLGELSFLIKERIVLSKVEFIAEKFQNEQKDKASTRTGAVVRAVRARNRQERDVPLGNVRFKVVIAGAAANGRDVANLTRELEKSPYFFQVVPSYSRSEELQIESSASPETAMDAVRRRSEVRGARADDPKNLQVSAFEINCYLANYRKL
ncbi:MAG: hypothetical protein JSW47_08515 [Phycisphaerales bacterium]|nr:MAG: hypothetical protein JSW47_08515 [Phycisphaerales bacterium]